MTNPSLTLASKLMQTLANCKAALSSLHASSVDTQAHELPNLIDLTHANLNRSPPAKTPMRGSQSDCSWPATLPRLELQIEQALAALDVDSVKQPNYCQNPQHSKYKMDRSRLAADEFGHLAQGVGNHNMTFQKTDNTMSPIAALFATYKLKKQLSTKQVLLPLRTGAITHTTTPTPKMLVARVLFNSVVSTPGAGFVTVDISNFYLMTPLLQPEYIRIKLSNLRQKIIDQYKLQDKVNRHGMIFVTIT
eukprot:CCRYP_014747-RA/>CCRYP_014747-RA protein AED:0.44 eAED:0.44 QI:0/0/0/1/0/0/3/0/248